MSCTSISLKMLGSVLSAIFAAVDDEEQEELEYQRVSPYQRHIISTMDIQYDDGDASSLSSISVDSAQSIYDDSAFWR